MSDKNNIKQSAGIEPIVTGGPGQYQAAALAFNYIRNYFSPSNWRPDYTGVMVDSSGTVHAPGTTSTFLRTFTYPAEAAARDFARSKGVELSNKAKSTSPRVDGPNIQIRLPSAGDKGPDYSGNAVGALRTRANPFVQVGIPIGAASILGLLALSYLKRDSGKRGLKGYDYDVS